MLTQRGQIFYLWYKNLLLILKKKCQLFHFGRIFRKHRGGTATVCGCETQGVRLSIKSKPVCRGNTYTGGLPGERGTANLVSSADMPSRHHVDSAAPIFTPESVHPDKRVWLCPSTPWGWECQAGQSSAQRLSYRFSTRRCRPNELRFKQRRQCPPSTSP